MSCHSSGSLEGGCPSSAEVIEDTEDFIQFEDLYSRLFAVERFTYLRDFSNYFCLIDFFTFKFERFCKLRDSLNKGLNRFSNVSLVHILRLFPHHPRGKSHWRIVFFLSGCSPIGISFHLNNYF